MKLKSVLGVVAVACLVLGILLMGAHFEFDQRIALVRGLHYPGYALLMVGVVILMGFVSTRASKHERHQAADMEVWLCGLQDAEHRRGGAKDVEAAVICGDDLVMGWAGAEEVAEFVVASTKACR